MARGNLRIYLGAAAGAGTTYATLDEALRRRGRGTQVVVGCVDTHDRPTTAGKLGELLGNDVRAAGPARGTDSTHPHRGVKNPLTTAATPTWRGKVHP